MDYKALVFDMDGTIADLYGVDNWLDMLRSENPLPYSIAQPLVNMDNLCTILKLFQELGYTIIITSWLSKGSSQEYKELVRQAKREWLRKYDFPYDEIHLVQYGTRKADCTRKKGGYQILIDDSAEVRKTWTLGATIDASADIMKPLIDLLATELTMR